MFSKIMLMDKEKRKVCDDNKNKKLDVIQTTNGTSILYSSHYLITRLGSYFINYIVKKFHPIKINTSRTENDN